MVKLSKRSKAFLSKGLGKKARLERKQRSKRKQAADRRSDRVPTSVLRAEKKRMREQRMGMPEYVGA